MQIRIHKIVPRSYVDGPGCRSVAFLQGCTLACPGCQNKHIWPADGGTLVETDDLAETLLLLAGESRAVTISGGEPFDQPAALLQLVSVLKSASAHIVVYTGYVLEALNPFVDILRLIDILVDGPYQREIDDHLIAWRGSRNQRPLDVQASLAAYESVALDWDSPQLIISPAGDVLLPAGLASAFTDLGSPAPTRMCGQTRGQL